MTKKIAIITLHTSSNYGSCLQAYATEKVFSSLGWDSVIIDYWRHNNLPKIKSERILKSIKRGRFDSAISKFPQFRRFVLQIILNRQNCIDAPFMRFRNNYLNLTERRYESYKDLESDCPEADVYCTGSDQVWNRIWNEGFEKAMYLDFVPKEKKCIAYAASIGRDSIDSVEVEEMCRALEKYDAISMRETSGVEIIESLGLKKPVQVIDPTLMLNRQEWENIATYALDVPNKFLLIYQLNKNNDLVKLAKKISGRFGLSIVNLCHHPSFQIKEAKNIVLPEVTDFISLFLKASFVVTDSFHGTAFSSNFAVPFYTMSPGRFSVRINDYLKLINLEDRYIKPTHEGLYGLDADEICFSDVQKSLNREREKAVCFLRSALNGTEVRR